MSPIIEQVASAARIMFPMNEQLANMVRTNLDVHISALTALTGKAIESMELLVDLTLDSAIASIADSGAAAKQLFTARDPQEFLSLAVAQAQPTVAKAIGYRRRLASIAAATQAEIARTAEQQVAEAGRHCLSTC
jgi:phasin family protein